MNISINSLVFPQGPEGQRGPVGLQGAEGPKGDTGKWGGEGSIGLPGPKVSKSINTPQSVIKVHKVENFTINVLRERKDLLVQMECKDHLVQQ